MVDVKASGQTVWCFNAMPTQALGVWIPQLNGLDQIFRQGNYCCSSIRVASIDENKKKTKTAIAWHALKPPVENASLFTCIKKRDEFCRETKITKMQTHNTNSDIQHSNLKKNRTTTRADSVTYWPRPNCQNRKCTCVNNRCIWSRIIRLESWHQTVEILYQDIRLGRSSYLHSCIWCILQPQYRLQKGSSCGETTILGTIMLYINTNIWKIAKYQ